MYRFLRWVTSVPEFVAARRADPTLVARLWGWSCLWLATVAGLGAAPSGAKPSSFGDDVQLAPFVVNGERLSISVHARTERDRRYAEKFAKDVIGVAYESLDGRSTG